MLELNRIYCADSLELMKEIPDKSIDLVLTDPPYGIEIDGQKESFSKNPKHNRKFHEFGCWDKAIPSQEYFSEIFRISQNQIIWGGNYFVDYFSEGHKGCLVWDKGQHGLTMSDGELAYSSFDFPLRIFNYNRVELLLDGAHHPTMKPLKLIKWCVELSKAETILDPFVGSGTTCLAAEMLGRKWIGIDLSRKYCDIAEKRIDLYKRQGKLELE